jgi:hypothetical protein
MNNCELANFYRTAYYKILCEMKKKFLLDEAMTNSINAAFQHAGVYEENFSNSKMKEELRRSLRTKILEYSRKYNRPLKGSHYSMIKKLADSMSSEFKGKRILRDNCFRIGISQKALNLYLKYLWCLGEIPTPPHCPIDRKITDVLDIPKSERKQYNWTELNCIKTYKKLISLCRKEAKKMSIAEWELKERQAQKEQTLKNRVQ